jgi:hypothetical protein
MRAVNDSHNDTGNGVTDYGTMCWIRDIKIGIDQDLIWLFTFSGLLTENGLATSSEAADLVSTGIVSEVTLTARCCRAFCDYPRECEQLTGWWRGTGWSAATPPAATAGHGGE